MGQRRKDHSSNRAALIRTMAAVATTAAMAVLPLVPAPAFAGVSEAQAAQLDSVLTPMGAERAGNAAGTIPEWTGGQTAAPECFQGEGMRYCDPYPQDRPLYTVTAANLLQFEKWLTPGQIALLRRHADTYGMPVYGTRRSFANPDFIYAATRGNALSAELRNNGEALFGARTGIPFPLPANGHEVIWNHKTRYRDVSVRRWKNQFAVTAAGDYSAVKVREDARYRYNEPVLAGETGSQIQYTLLQLITEPPRLAGSVLLIEETLDQAKAPRRAWQHSPGQKRLRRVTNFGYDTLGTGADGLRTNDQIDTFNGAMDRYDWKLVGKQEVLVPANSYRLHSDALSYSQILGKRHLNQELTRYELRRVWVVDAQLRASAAHVYKRRRFYVDEDSWQIRVVDIYDSRSELWRVQETHTLIAYDKPYELPVAETVYDLQDNRYLAQALDNEDAEAATVLFEEDFFEPGKVSSMAAKLAK
jgi:hypothetical protein